MIDMQRNECSTRRIDSTVRLMTDVSADVDDGLIISLYHDRAST